MAQTKIKSGQLYLSGSSHGTDGQALLSNADGTMRWGDIQIPGPGYTSLDYPGTTTALNAAGGQTLIINGSGYDGNTTVTFGTTSVSAISVLSATQLSVTTPALANGTYDLVLGNAAGGTTTESNVIIYNATPSWTTAAGSLGSVEKNSAANFTVAATEPDGGAITYAVTSGALPTGLSLNTSSGAITGTATPSISSDTTYNFTITATDNENQTNARAFSIEVTVPLPSERFEVITYTGNGGTQKIEGGKILRGAEFNGSNSILTAPRMFSTNSSYSISFWAKIASGSTNQACLIWQISGTSQRSFGLSYSGSGAAYNFGFNHKFATNTGQNNLASFTPDGNWHHFAGSFNSSTSTGAIYIDGNLQGATFTLDPVSDTGNTLYIGGAYVYNGVTQYKALSGLDQLRIFDKAISSSEVTTLYQEDDYTSTTKSTTDIFNDGSGVALYELESNANATISNVADTHYFFVGDLGNQLTDVRVNTVSSEFTYTAPSGYSDWGGALNPNNTSGSQTFTFSESDKRWTKTQSGFYNSVWSTIAHNSGKYYFEIEFLNKNIQFGISKLTTADNWTNNLKNNSIVYLDYVTSSYEYSTTNLNQGQIIYGASNGTSVIGIACDFDSKTFYYYYNNTLVDTATISSSNFNGTASNVKFKEGTKFSPDLVWIKNRDATYNHMLYDVIRGATKTINSNTTGAEGTHSDALTYFNSDGFTVGSKAHVNASGQDIVAWCFNAGTGNATNGTGTGGITNVSYKANIGAGFSIVKYTGSGTNGTVTHGLSSPPTLIISKTTSAAYNWMVYSSATGSGKQLILNSSAAAATSSTFMNNTDPTSTVFTAGGGNNLNYASGDEIIAYCFHSVDGYQKIGSYTGNGSANGPIIETGFEPAFLMVKITSGGDNWVIVDNERDISNPRNTNLKPNSNAAEVDEVGTQFNFLTNGFQPTGSGAGQGQANANGSTYIYLAIATDPDITQPTQANSFGTVAYTGNGSTQDLDFGFKPDLVWIKNRSNANPHSIQDTVTGDFYLRSNAADAAAATSGNNVSSFNSNGITVKDTSSGAYNVNGSVGGTYSGNAQYVAWAWKAGDHNDSLPTINTTGTIDSLVSANQNAGFSIVKYTGTGTNATVGHGLSAAPEIRIIKGLSSGTSETQNWFVWVAGIGTNNEMILNGTGTPAYTASVMNQNQTPTSTTFPIGSDGRVNQSGKDYIAYCWHSVTGYSKIGTYSGSNSSLSITTGFRPSFLLIKRTDTSGSWVIIDNIRGDGAGAKALFPDLNNAETHSWNTTFNNTGFTIDSNEVWLSTSGGTYIYMAFK